MSTDRDLKMGRALAGIPLPELSEGFYSELVVSLEQVRPAAVPRQARLFRVGIAAAAVAAAVAVAVVLFGLPGVHSTAPQPSLAAQVLAKMSSSLGEIKTFQADEVDTKYKADGTSVTSTLRVFLTAGGDGRMEWAHGKGVTIINARRGIYLSLSRVGGRLVAEGVSTGVAPGTVWSTVGGSANMLMMSGYGTALRALLAARQPGIEVHSGSLDGRPVWTVDLAYGPTKGDGIRLTVDQQTGLVFAWSESGNGKPLWESHVENVRLNQPLAPGLFLPPAGLDLAAPHGAGQRTDWGFRRMPLAQVQGVVGYAPLVPSAVPDGYTLADVTAVAKSETTVPMRSPLVSLVYRRGLGSFTVAVMPDDNGNPFGDLEGGAVTTGDLSQHVTLAGGALKGSRADIFIGLWAATAQIFVWGSGEPLKVMIKGDLTRDELVAVAESLQSYGGAP